MRQQTPPLKAASSRAGFTLIEIMLVVAIIGFIALVVLQTIDPKKSSDDARRTTTLAIIGQMAQTVDLYYLDIGKYPTKLEDLKTNPGLDKWNGPYAKKIKADAWGDALEYSVTGGSYVIRSNAGGSEAGPITSDDL